MRAKTRDFPPCNTSRERRGLDMTGSRNAKALGAKMILHHEPADGLCSASRKRRIRRA